MADSDDSDRFAGTQRDTLTSFIKTSGALTAMTAERNEALAAIKRVRALLHPDNPLRAIGVREADIQAALEPTP